MENRVAKTAVWMLLAIIYAVASVEIYHMFKKDKAPPNIPSDKPNEDNDVSAVSGTSLLWAIVALAVYAMTQPSYTGHWTSGETFAGLLWPHRSSPVVCVADCILEINEWDMMWQRKGRREQGERMHFEGPSDMPTEEEEKEKSPSAAFMLRLGAFILGVVPQAIKLFSMTGIWKTQIVAAAYFVPSLWNLIQSAPGTKKRPVSRPVWTVEKWLRNGEEEEERLKDSQDPLMLTWFVHLDMVGRIWAHIGEKTTVPCPEAVREVIPKVQLTGKYVWFVIALSAVMIWPSRTMFMAKRTKTSVVVISIWLVSAILDLFLPKKDKSSGSSGTPHFLAFTTTCFGVACGLKLCAEWMGGTSKVGSEDVVPPSQEERPATITPPAPSGTVEADIGMQSLTAASTPLAESTTVSDTQSRASQTSNTESGRDGDTNGSRPGILRKIFRDIVSVFWRLTIGYLEVCLVQPMAWCIVVLVRHHIETWVAFALLNLGTAIIYYFWLFDGSGTWAPGWSQALG